MLDWLTLAGTLATASTVYGAGLLYFYHQSRVSREIAVNGQRLIDNLSEGIYRSSFDGKQLSANRALVRLNGYASEREMLAAVNNIEKEWYVDPNRRSEFKELLFRNGYVEDFVSEIWRYKTRERIWISENARLIVDPKTGVPLYYEGSVRDVSERIRKQQVETRLNKLADMAPGGLFQLRRDEDGNFSTPFMSQPFKAMAGLQSSAVLEEMSKLKRPLLAGIHDADYADYIKTLTDSYSKLKPWNCVFRYRREPDAPLQWLEIKALPERADNGAIEWYGCMADISEHKELVQRIERLAYYDPLTDLPNRRLLMNRLVEATKISGRRRRHGGLLFIDLDGFKSVNDNYGHESGDAYITKIARCLEGSLRDSDTIARLGGDEFVVLLHDLGAHIKDAKNDASMVAAKLMANLRRGVELNGIVQSVTCSIGLTVFKGNIETADCLIRNADRAMYQAKAAGRNRCVVYEEPQDALVQQQMGAA